MANLDREDNFNNRIVVIASDLEARINFWINNDDITIPEVCASLYLVKSRFEYLMNKELDRMEEEDENEEKDKGFSY